jgi:NADH:ubiquinone oxidoreductase subunit 6 (subunit J)
VIGQTLALDFAEAFQVALYVGAGILVVAFLVAVTRLPAGRQEDIV